MDESIKRQAALDALQPPEIFNITPRHIELIKNIPAADVVPVVRCKDCKYSCCISDSRYCAHCNYPFADCEVDDNFYCAYGARKDGGACNG